MTHTPTQEPLDSFESALLTELRQHAVAQPVTAPAPVRRRRRLAAVAAAGLAASVAGVVGLTTLGGTPAYAVDVDSDGDVVVTVHRLDDAAGLEKALRAKGIDADVSYDANPSTHPHTVGVGLDGEPVSEDEMPPPPGTGPQSGSQVQGEAGTITSEAVGEGEPEFGTSNTGPGGGPAPADDPCGLSTNPADLSQQGDDWVLRIPAGSPLMDRSVEIGTDAQGGLSVFFEGNEPGAFCGVMQAKAQRAP
jgi:hypothetical protein